MRMILYQTRFKPHATWSQGSTLQFLQEMMASLAQEEMGTFQVVRVKVGDSIPEALAPHVGRPIRMTCDGPEWVCEVY